MKSSNTRPYCSQQSQLGARSQQEFEHTLQGNIILRCQQAFEPDISPQLVEAPLHTLGAPSATEQEETSCFQGGKGAGIGLR